VSEADLITLARTGDAVACESLVRQHQQAAFRLAYLLLGDAVDAEDVTQEAFLRALKALDGFDVSRPFRPWLLRITANLAHNRRRSMGRYWAALRRLAQATPDRAVTGRSSPIDSDDAGWQAQTLWEAVRRLSEPDQQVIYLRFFLGLSEAEAAATLQIAVGTVKSRLHRALGRLRAVTMAEFPELMEGHEHVG
jgi:RNA polymerase sigma-70 factor (ECF subfamily)